LLEDSFINPNDNFCTEYKISVPRRTSLADMIRQSKNKEVEVLSLLFKSLGILINKRLVRALAISIKYDGYINKSEVQARKVKRLDKRSLNVTKILESENISFECKQRIGKIKPNTFGQLRIIEGIRPATLAVIAGTLS
jgi:tRNA uridine 5-carboxymethylaminomethyl modification enzyme